MRVPALTAYLLAAAVLATACSPIGAPTLPKPSSAPAAASLEAFVPVAERFVEQHRGLKFKQKVTVRFLPDSTFRSRLAETSKPDTKAFATEAKVLEALGLVDGHPDLAKAEQELQGAGVIGYYDPKTKELAVRGVDAKPSVRHVLVHELTHALQDQWFGLDRPSHNEDESDLAFSSLVEGDAVRIENLYISSLSETDRAQASQTSGTAPPADVPQVLLELASFPYLTGPPFARAVLNQGGQARLDRAFATPPTTTAQVIHPDLFLAGQPPPQVDFPEAGGAVIDKGVIGEFGLDLLLERMVGHGEVTRADAQTIATGWNGDRYVAWEHGAQTCVRTRLQTTGPAVTRILLAALGRFVADHPGTTVEGSGPVLFTICG
jgi:hypothetical protein